MDFAPCEGIMFEQLAAETHARFWPTTVQRTESLSCGFALFDWEMISHTGDGGGGGAREKNV